MAERFTLMSLEIKGTFLAVVAFVSALGIAFGLSPLLQSKSRMEEGSPPNVTLIQQTPLANGDLKRGHQIFDRNCAHCHGDDARGDEGPDLHNLIKSNARITAIVKERIKGEMPGFGKKLSDADVMDLIAFLRSLKD